MPPNNNPVNNTKKEEITTHIFFLGLSGAGKTTIRQIALHGKSLDELKYKETKKPVIIRPKNKPNYVFYDFGGKEKNIKEAVKMIQEVPSNERKIIAWILDGSNIDGFSTSIAKFKEIKNIVGEANENLRYVLGITKIDLLNSSQLELLKEKLPEKLSIIFKEPIQVSFFTAKDSSLQSFIKTLFELFSVPLPENWNLTRETREVQKIAQEKETIQNKQPSLINKTEIETISKEPQVQPVKTKKKKKKIKKTGIRLSSELGIKNKNKAPEPLIEDEIPLLEEAITPTDLLKPSPKIEEAPSTIKPQPSAPTISPEEKTKEEIELPEIEDLEATTTRKPKRISPTDLLPPELKDTVTPKSPSPPGMEQKISPRETLSDLDELLENVEKAVGIKKQKPISEAKPIPETTVSVEDTEPEEEILLPPPEEPVFQRLPPPIPLSENKQEESGSTESKESLPELERKAIPKKLIEKYCKKHNISYLRIFADFGVVDLEYKRPELDYLTDIANQLIDKFQTADKEEVLEQVFNDIMLFTILFPKIMIIVGVPEQIAEKFYSELPKIKQFVNDILNKLPFAKISLTPEQINSIPPLQTPETVEAEIKEEEYEPIYEEELEVVDETEEIPEYPVINLKNIENKGTIIIFQKQEESEKIELLIAFSSEENVNEIIHVHLPIIKTMIKETKETKFFDTETHTVAIRVGKEYSVVILTRSKYDHKDIIRYLGQIIVYLALLRTKKMPISFETLSKDSKLMTLTKSFLTSSTS